MRLSLIISSPGVPRWDLQLLEPLWCFGRFLLQRIFQTPPPVPSQSQPNSHHGHRFVKKRFTDTKFSVKHRLIHSHHFFLSGCELFEQKQDQAQLFSKHLACCYMITNQTNIKEEVLPCRENQHQGMKTSTLQRQPGHQQEPIAFSQFQPLCRLSRVWPA